MEQEIEIDAGAFIIDQGNVFNGVASGFDSGGRFVIDKNTGQVHYAVKRTQLQAVFAPYGAINATISTTTMPIPFSIITGNINYTGNFTFAYKATMGKTGMGKMSAKAACVSKRPLRGAA